ncbi:heterokaryon incompatibility protein [Colletotrichum chrysophilum]|uniref:Heterokaryon incompatibility protein n=1 Tax=Colletotrichum chrysophilum TaxID=1836956 RepID=A0AAD9EE56_9PEZI|nr:heterokaryon incompatibility protein [Colletotrichum chrysophilum]
MLCEYCLPIFQGIDKPPHPDWKPPQYRTLKPFEKSHHPNWKSLEISVTQGCMICKQLHWKTRDSSPDELTESSWTYYLLDLSGEQDGAMRLTIGTESRSGVTQEEYLRMVPCRFINTNPSIGSRNGKLPASESLQSAREWMRLCSGTHEDCRGPNQPDTFPTRLLKIGVTGVKLILTKDKKPTGTYAALSYCWGPPPYNFPRLTTSNMDEMLESEIPNATLPLAFRQAISFVQGLGIHYVWIDCLCIVQEGTKSAEDWKFESSNMKSVYSNCDLCLSLDRATSPQESILHGPTPEFMAPFEINTTGIFDADDFSTESTKCVVFAKHYFENSLYRLPLGFRAWALQEKILPRRVLGFGEGELFWSCRQLPHACESFPSGIASSVVPGLPFSPSFIPVTSDLTNSFDIWCDLVGDYSNRSLTYPEKDKLVAFSAVASLMEEATSDCCVAGHLWKSILNGLLWQTDQSETRGIDDCLAIRETLHIPTWSWASVGGRVWFKTARESCTSGFTPLARATRYFEPRKSLIDGDRLPSVLLELDGYRIEGIIRTQAADGYMYAYEGFRHTLIIDHPAGFESQVFCCNIRMDHVGGIDNERAIFCPIFLRTMSSFLGEGECDFAYGTFQTYKGLEVDGQRVYERIAMGYIRLTPGVSWHEVVKDLGMERSSVLLG